MVMILIKKNEVVINKMEGEGSKPREITRLKPNTSLEPISVGDKLEPLNRTAVGMFVKSKCIVIRARNKCLHVKVQVSS